MKFYHFNAPGPYFTNTFVIISEAGNAAIVDACAAPERYQKILEENGAALRMILQTHSHSDHTGAIEPLREATGATVYLNRADAAQFGIRADQDLTDGEKISLDELTFEVITTPGHTPGSVCIRLGDLLFTGDTLFAGDIGRTDLAGGSYPEICASLKKLLARVEDNPKVLPGHEEFSTFETERQTNPYLR